MALLVHTHGKSTVRGLATAVTAAMAACLIVGCGSDTGNEGTGAASGSVVGATGASPAGNTAGVGTGGAGATVSQGVLGGKPGVGGRGGASGKAVSGRGGSSGKSGSAAATSKGGKGGSAGAKATGGEASCAPTLPPVTGVDGAGPFRTSQELNAGPSRSSGLFYPTELGKDGIKHPIFVWGCGGTTTPSFYATVLSQIASHGFVAIGEVAEIGDNGAPLKACIDWAVSENENAQSKFYHKLDTSKIALGGHSIGSANSFYIATDPHVATTVFVAGGSLDDVNAPFAETTGWGGKSLVRPVAYIIGATDEWNNIPKFDKDYANTTVPAFYTKMTGVTHNYATQSGLPVIIGWLRWHLGCESERSSMFIDSAGEFCTGIFVSESKNW